LKICLGDVALHGVVDPVHARQRVHHPINLYSNMHLRLIDSCITQLKAQGPSRTCNESKEGEKEASHQSAVPHGGVRPFDQKSTCIMQLTFRDPSFHQAGVPHGGVRTFNQKSTCLTQLTLGPNVVKTLSRSALDFRSTRAREPIIPSICDPLAGLAYSA